MTHRPLASSSRPRSTTVWVSALVAITLLTGQAPLPATLQPPLTPPTPLGFDAVALTSRGERGAALTSFLRRPHGQPPHPAVIMLHGCGGLFTAKGQLTQRETDWSDRFLAAGYAVLLVDSFNPRGFREVCTLNPGERTVRPFDRARDAAAGFARLAADPTINKDRIAIIGWSHGGSTALWSIDHRLKFEGAEVRVAIAFYPGCRIPAESANWAPRLPITVLMGDTDDWTPPEPCRALAAKHPTVRLIEYPGAVHGFDAPNSALRTLTGLGATKDGRAKIGTDPKARAAAIAEVERILKDAFK